ncbi:hypothetical protein [Corynebacterium sp. AOP12-C2-36]|uniref:hypothetical protein n=1 Tax=Corynebacterium sp. AOP12-C2-36 TaxID=3457723 RepID=UPI0040334EDB
MKDISDENHLNPRQGYLRRGILGSEHDDLQILETAHRHGVSDEIIKHALRYPISQFVQEDGMTMIIGPGWDGTPVEIGLVAWHDGVAVVHAMRPARKKIPEGITQ